MFIVIFVCVFWEYLPEKWLFNKTAELALDELEFEDGGMGRTGNLI